MKTYTGDRVSIGGGLAEPRVTVQLMDDGGINDYPLPQRQDLYNHSPDGFEWSYAGSGPAQLALAILADFLEDEKEAVALHQAFKELCIAGLPSLGWELTSQDMTIVLNQIRKKQAKE